MEGTPGSSESSTGTRWAERHAFLIVLPKFLKWRSVVGETVTAWSLTRDPGCKKLVRIKMELLWILP